jgi:phage I-like protein
METALQELISKLTAIKNDLVIDYEKAKKEQERTEISREIVATLSAISEAKKLLHKERKQIIDAAYAGKFMQCRDGDKTPQEYYETNFNK